MRHAAHIATLLSALTLACNDAAPLPSRATGPVWIDADVAIELPLHDVDDAWAIAYALRRYPASIVGISLVHGNTDDMAHQEFATTRLLEQLAPRSVPLYVGASSAQDRAPTAASDALVAALRQGPLTLLTMGRLTNVATALRAAPELAANVQELVILGGRRADFNPSFGPDDIIFPDSNVEGDAAAVEELVELDVPITLIPTELTTQFIITEPDLAAVAAQGTAGAYLARHSEDWLTAVSTLVGIDGFFPFDLFVTAYADDAHHDLITCRDVPLRLDYGPDESFKQRKEPVLRVMVSPDFGGPSVRYCDAFAADGKAALLRTF
ncbi:MAG: nucleoside hydrolase [Myxococcales bacterium]|nr:nucleoside hydrolase [Myxococcales bacterium]